MNEKFAKWWETDGQFIDPDSADVPWFDKREELAENAYLAGLEAERERARPLVKTLKKVESDLCKNANDLIFYRDNNRRNWIKEALASYTTPQNDGKRDCGI